MVVLVTVVVVVVCKHLMIVDNGADCCASSWPACKYLLILGGGRDFPVSCWTVVVGGGAGEDGRG